MSKRLMASQQVLPRAAERQRCAFEHAKLAGALATVLSSQHQTAA